MTAKTIRNDERGNPTKMPGWFSWRHKSRDAHEEAAARYLSEHGPEARRRKAAARPDDHAFLRTCGHVHGNAQADRCKAVA